MLAPVRQVLLPLWIPIVIFSYVFIFSYIRFTRCRCLNCKDFIYVYNWNFTSLNALLSHQPSTTTIQPTPALLEHHAHGQRSNGQSNLSESDAILEDREPGLTMSGVSTTPVRPNQEFHRDRLIPNHLISCCAKTQMAQMKIFQAKKDNRTRSMRSFSFCHKIRKVSLSSVESCQSDTISLKLANGKTCNQR